MNETGPSLRRDLEFFPIQHAGKHLVFIQDHLGLVPEGKAVALSLYQIMTLLDGTKTVRDLQMELMRQRGGVLVGSDEVKMLLAKLDESFLLDSERFKTASNQIAASFASKKVRPCSHCGRAYPEKPLELGAKLDEILATCPPVPEPEGEIRALISPHIDLTAGCEVYSSAYQMLKFVAPSRVVLLGVGHRMQNDLFSLTDKDFETPLGAVKNERSRVNELREAGRSIIAANDFAHRSEHSIEFQLIFLQHLLEKEAFEIIPILCGSLQLILPDYSRNSYLERAGPFLKKLNQLLTLQDKRTLFLAGVDFSHIGPKFGHEMPAGYLKSESEAHDKRLLEHLSRLDANRFWEESRSVEDKFNVCGFSALACMLEVLPPCRGKVLDHKFWHEEATRSAVSFAAVVFTS